MRKERRLYDPDNQNNTIQDENGKTATVNYLNGLDIVKRRQRIGREDRYRDLNELNGINHLIQSKS